MCLMVCTSTNKAQTHLIKFSNHSSEVKRQAMTPSVGVVMPDDELPLPG